MKKIFLACICAGLLAGCSAKTAGDLKPLMDKYETPIGDLYIKVLGHASIIMTFFDNVIYVDPYSREANYNKLPKASLILITHDHYDHLDLKAIKAVLTPRTHIIASQAAAEKIKSFAPDYEVLSNGQSTQYKGIRIDAVPAYNIINKDSSGQPYHPMGRGNGYILNFANFRFYIAGDTEITPEMKNLRNIYTAFLPKNEPYTMSDAMFIQAAIMLHPSFLYPYHYDTLDKAELEEQIGPDTKLK